MSAGGIVQSSQCQCPSALSAPTTLSDIAVPVGWLLIVVGWVIVQRGQTQRAERAEAREVIRECYSLVKKLEELGRQYWLVDGTHETAPGLATDIKAQFKVLSALCGALKRKSDRFAIQGLVAFRQAVTGGNFDSPGRGAITAGHPRLMEIQDAACQVIEDLEYSFDDLFQARTWRSALTLRERRLPKKRP